jgi:hypothetical protein
MNNMVEQYAGTGWFLKEYGFFDENNAVLAANYIYSLKSLPLYKKLGFHFLLNLVREVNKADTLTC